MTLVATSPVAMPGAHVDGSAEEPEMLEITGLRFTREQVEHEDFLSLHCDELAAKIADDVYWSRYEPENRVRDLSDCAAAAQAMVEAHTFGNDPLVAARRSLSSLYGTSSWYLEDELVRPEVERFIEKLERAADDLGWSYCFDADDENADELRQAVCEIAEERDDSTPFDVLGSCDRVEIAFVFMQDHGYFDDNCTASHRSWSEWSELSLSEGFLNTLPRLGYTLEQYLAHSKNQHEVQDEVFHPRPPRLPVATLDELQEAVDNACAQYFNFAIYAHVPLRDFLKMDLSKPIRLDRYSVATINMSSGTFHDICKDQPIILRPDEGRFHVFEKGPADWCGLVGSYYHAEISQ